MPLTHFKIIGTQYAINSPERISRCMTLVVQKCECVGGQTNKSGLLY